MERQPVGCHSYFQQSAELNDVQKVQNHQDDNDNDQNMDPTAGTWEPWAYVPTQETEQPQYYKNYNDSPQHEISPFERFAQNDGYGRRFK